MHTLIIGLSGPSSSGKTTLSHLLTSIFPSGAVTLLHGDDFCKEFDQIPTVNGYLDCDGPSAIDFDRMVEVLDFMRLHSGEKPEGFSSWQEDVFPGQREKALDSAGPKLIAELKEQVERSGVVLEDLKLVVLDGFLLFQNEEIRKRLDLKLFFRLSHDVAKKRRFGRQGYGVEAKEGEFWKTEDYFEKMVWRSYIENHGFMFLDGDVHGAINRDVCGQTGIQVLEDLNPPLPIVSRWAVDKLLEVLKPSTKSRST